MLYILTYFNYLCIIKCNMKLFERIKVGQLNIKITIYEKT
jgi:hypothetical protein